MEVDSSPDSESRPPRRVLDNWEDAADGTTPDDEDVSEETVMRTKKKPAKAEETKSKKEHVNVVFIGHVGEFM
jgi:peptide chain release factor subunit 3